MNGSPATSLIIRRGEIWMVNLGTTTGSELQKTRPVVVISSNSVGTLPIKLVAPLTGWQNMFASNIWHVKLSPNKGNRLNKQSAVDILQLRAVAYQRFERKVGEISSKTMQAITAAVVAVIEHE